MTRQMEYFNLDDFGRRPFTRKSRVMEFVKKSDNLVDLVAIMSPAFLGNYGPFFL